MTGTASNGDKQIRNLNALLEISKLMGSKVELDGLLQLILEKATEVMEAERSSLFLYDASTNELWSKIAQGMTTQEIRFPVGMGIAGDVAKTLKPANIHDAYKDPRFNPAFDKKSEFKTHAVLCLPMMGTDGKLVGVIQVLNKKTGDVFDAEDEGLLEALGGHAAVALQRAQLIESFVENQILEESLKLANNIQMSMLPKRFPPFPEKTDVIDIFASIEPAKDVGGDLYDFFLVDDDHLCFAIGDVSGKGVPAALFMAVTKTLIQAVTHKGMHPYQILVKMNDLLSTDNEADMFCTFFICILNLKTGEVQFSNGGHNPPYILRLDGTFEPLKKPIGVALGVMDGLEFEPNKTKLEPGEAIFLYTDGVNEAMNEEFQEYSYSRMEALLHKVHSDSAESIVTSMIKDVKTFVGKAPQSDDITVLAFRFNKLME